MITRLARIVLVLSLCAAVAAQSCAGAQSSALQELLTAVESPSGPPSDLDNATRLAIEVGEMAVPDLKRLLKATSDRAKQRRLSWVLAYVGGSSAVAALQDYAASEANVNAKAPLLFAVPSAPSEAQVRLLIGSLNGQHIGDEWFPIVQAAFSLGVMRERSATSALQRAADKREGFASSAAETALRWIRTPGTEPTIRIPSNGDDVLRVALAYPVVELERFSELCEVGAVSRRWRRVNTGWLIEPGCTNAPEYPRVFLETYRSTDGTRAVMAIGFVAGPLDGAGYNFVFRRQGNGWVVVGIQPTWVS